jgi:hypothetical protein
LLSAEPAHAQCRGGNPQSSLRTTLPQQQLLQNALLTAAVQQRQNALRAATWQQRQNALLAVALQQRQNALLAAALEQQYAATTLPGLK